MTEQDAIAGHRDQLEKAAAVRITPTSKRPVPALIDSLLMLASVRFFRDVIEKSVKR